MIAHKVKVVLGVVITICIVMAIPSFASPQLSDADITFSVRGYYTQYGITSSWTRGYVASNGNIIGPNEAYVGYSDYISVTPGGTVFCFYAPNGSVFGHLHSCFYDSEYNVVPGGNDINTIYLHVPEGVSFVRISQGYTLGANAMIVSCPDYVNSFEQAKFLFHTFDNLQIDSDGVLTIPYQVYAFNQIYLDFRFFDSVYQFSNIAFKVLSEYSGSSVFGGLVDYGTGQVLAESYTLIDDDIHTSAISSSTSNPARFAFNIPFSEFSGFLLYIPVNFSNGSVSTGIKIKVFDFQLDGEDVSARLEVDRTLNELDDLASQLAVPTPDLNTLLDVGGVLNNQNDANASMIMSIISSDGGLITTMMVISVSLTVLGYILFGKKEA